MRKDAMSPHGVGRVNLVNPYNYNGQFSRSEWYASNTQRPRLSGSFSPRLCTIAAVFNNLTLVTRSISLCLAFPASVQQRKARKRSYAVLNSWNYAVPRLPEITAWHRQSAVNMLSCESTAAKRPAFTTVFTPLMYTST